MQVQEKCSLFETSLTLIFTVTYESTFFLSNERNLNCNKGGRAEQELYRHEENKHTHVLCQDPYLEHYFGG